jgi:hypothetical protein
MELEEIYLDFSSNENTTEKEQIAQEKVSDEDTNKQKQLGSNENINDDIWQVDTDYFEVENNISNSEIKLREIYVDVYNENATDKERVAGNCIEENINSEKIELDEIRADVFDENITDKKQIEPKRKSCDHFEKYLQGTLAMTNSFITPGLAPFFTTPILLCSIPLMFGNGVNIATSTPDFIDYEKHFKIVKFSRIFTPISFILQFSLIMLSPWQAPSSINLFIYPWIAFWIVQVLGFFYIFKELYFVCMF